MGFDLLVMGPYGSENFETLHYKLLSILLSWIFILGGGVGGSRKTTFLYNWSFCKFSYLWKIKFAIIASIRDVLQAYIS